MQRAQFKIDVQSDEPVWTPARQDLWRRVEQHDFEPDTALNFTRRLARDHGWSVEYARAAVDAYRRFCFLAVVSPTPVTPSEVVDEVWHQHLVYSRDYWTIWCGKTLQAPLHHDPTPGGPDAQMIIVGNMPKRWRCTNASSGRRAPSSGQRHICASDARGIMRRTAAVGLSCPSPSHGFAVCSGGELMTWNPFNWTAEPFLALYLTLAVIVFLLGFSFRSVIGPAAHATRRLSVLELAFLGGGARRLGDAALLCLTSGNGATIAAKDHTITVTDQAPLATLMGRPIRLQVLPRMTRQQFQAAIKPLVDRVQGRLQELGYCPTDDR